MLVLAGLLVLVADRLSWSLLVDGAVTGLVVLVGVALVLGPWMLRTGRASIEERRERVRAEEREAVAAHLHDSVLQTLTLIQKRSADPDADPRVVAALARRQERELRRWLYGSTDGWEPDARLRDAIDATVADVEDLHGVTIESVIVGDAGIDDRVAALVAATREALVNAAKFSGSSRPVVVRRGRHRPPPRSSCATVASASTPLGCPRTVTASATRSWVAWRTSDGAAVVHSAAGAGTGTEVVLTLPAVSRLRECRGRRPGRVTVTVAADAPTASWSWSTTTRCSAAGVIAELGPGARRRRRGRRRRRRRRGHPRHAARRGGARRAPARWRRPRRDRRRGRRSTPRSGSWRCRSPTSPTTSSPWSVQGHAAT